MTRRSGNKSSNNNATTTTLDIGKKPVVATTATEDTVEAASSSSKAGDDDDKTMMASTNDNDDTLPIEDAMTINDATGATTDAGVAAVIDEPAAMMEPSNDDDVNHGGDASNPETSLENGYPDNDDYNDANNTKSPISEEDVACEDDEDEEEKVELWDLKVVLSAKQIRMAQPTLCQSDKCNLVACCIWSSNLDPETPWYSCLDCQEEHFGGWPSTEESDGSGSGTGLPIKVLSDDLREAMMDKCTQLVDPVLPNLPSSIGGEVVGGTKASDGNEETNNDDAEEAADDADDDDGEVLWELKKVFSIKELTKSKPMKCKTDDCDRLACSVWKSSEGDSWYSCLDCQEK